MKLIIATLLFAGLQVHAEDSFVRVSERVIADNTTHTTLDLRGDRVRCSSLGYGSRELKIAVPDLQWLAVFNHRNSNETLPCMTAGPCKAGNMPEDITSHQTLATAETEIRVQTVEVDTVDPLSKVCQRTLEERLSATIQGKPFTHIRFADLGTVPEAACPKP